MSNLPSLHRSPAGSTRILAAAGLIALLGGILAIALSSDGRSGAQQPQAAAPPTTTTSLASTEPRQTRPRRVRIAVTGAGAYDPDGDGSENNGDAILATDGNRATAWKSEHYRAAFAKTGIGLVVDAGRPVKATGVVVITETPGYEAQIRVGPSPEGPFAAVSKATRTTTRTTIALRPRSGRYLMVWITSMPAQGTAAVNELTVTVAG